MRRLDPFKVTLIVGALFAGLLGWSILTASDRQHERAEAAGLASAELEIEQMMCSMCRAEILHALRTTDGVREVTPERKGATVAYEPAKLTPRALVRIVKRTGYDASLRRTREATPRS